MTPRVLVVGAGISGLVAARTLVDAGCEVVVLETAERVGGRILSLPWGGRTLDAGASHIWSFYRHTRRWMELLGLSPELIPVGAAQRFALGLGDLPAVARAAIDVGIHWTRLDLARPLRAAPLDRGSIADYAARRVPRHLVEAVLRPAFEWNAFVELEEMSQVLLLQAGRLFVRARPYTVRGGLERLPQALAQSLDVRLGRTHQVLGLRTDRDRVEARLSGGGRVEAAAAVVATLPAQAAGILQIQGPPGDFLRGVRHSRVLRGWWRFPATVGDPEWRLAASPRGGGAVASSRVVGDEVLASSVLYGPAARGVTEKLAPTRLAQTLELLPELAGRTVLDSRSVLWPAAVTTFVAGHFRGLAEVFPALPRGRIRLAGDYLVSPTVEGAVLSGERAAGALLRSSILDG